MSWKRKERALLTKWKLRSWKCQGHTLATLEAKLRREARRQAQHGCPPPGVI